MTSAREVALYRVGLSNPNNNPNPINPNLYPNLKHAALLAVREWEREEMGITNGNGKGMGIKPG